MEPKITALNSKDLIKYLLNGVPTHPEIENFTASFLESMQQYKLKTFSNSAFIQAVELTCCIFPHCTTYETIRNIALANLIAFHFDDLVSDKVVKKEILDQYDTTDTIYIKENRFILTLMHGIPQPDLRRYLLQLKLWRMNALYLADAAADDKNYLPFQDYLYWRLIDVGHQLIRTLLPYSLGYTNYSENELRISLKLRTFEANTLLLNLYMQDLASYRKEMEEAFPDNLLLLSKEGASEQNIQELSTAILTLHEEINESKKILIKDLPDKEELIHTVYDFTYGAFNFYLITKRYSNKEKCYVLQ